MMAQFGDWPAAGRTLSSAGPRSAHSRRVPSSSRLTDGPSSTQHRLPEKAILKREQTKADELQSIEVACGLHACDKRDQNERRDHHWFHEVQPGKLTPFNVEDVSSNDAQDGRDEHNRDRNQW